MLMRMQMAAMQQQAMNNSHQPIHIPTQSDIPQTPEEIGREPESAEIEPPVQPAEIPQASKAVRPSFFQ